MRPFFGDLRACKLTTEKLNEYRAKRKAEGKSDTTINRELAMLRIALRLGQRHTPPKVLSISRFPVVREDNARQGFLTDEQYGKVRDALPPYLRPLFVTAYETGIRRNELLQIRWDQVDLQDGFITLERGATKNGEGRSVPIVDGDMKNLLVRARVDRDASHPRCPWVFNNEGEHIRVFKGAWESACKRAGVPQVVRMKISGHKTDSLERRYNIVDTEDLRIAKKLMSTRTKET